MHITPVNSYREYKQQTHKVKLAGVNFSALTPEAFSLLQKTRRLEFSQFSYFTSDPVPLLWNKWYEQLVPILTSQAKDLK